MHAAGNDSVWGGGGRGRERETERASERERERERRMCEALAEYHFKQQLLIQVARHVNCNKKQLLEKLEGKVRGLVVHRTQQTGRRIIAGRSRARSARIYFNRKEDTGPQTPCSRRASLQKSSQNCFLLRSKVLSFTEEKEK
jgi:hypothetical protein